MEQGLAAIVKEHYPEAEVLMGTSTAGIAHAAITAHLLELPMGYVRSGAKDHGRKNQIEGKLLPGQKVVVIEDSSPPAAVCWKWWTCSARRGPRCWASPASSPTA